MALDKTALAASLKDTFLRAKEETWSSDQVADALADALETFVRGGEVNGVQVEVRNSGGSVIGTGTQSTAVAVS